MVATVGRHDEGLTQEQIAERNAKREIQLSLTYRMAGVFLALARSARRKSVRQHEANVARGWKPEPGKFDKNLARIGVMDDVISQLEPLVSAAEEKEDGDSNAH